VETVFARLAPLEAKLAEVEGRLGGLDPQAALDRFAERLEGLQGRLGSLEDGATAPFAEITEALGRLYAQKDATAESVLARLAPLEAKLAEIEGRLGAPEAALAGFADRVAAAERAQAGLEDRIEGRLGALERPAVDPLAGLKAEIEGLRGHRDAVLEAVTGRLAVLEAQLGSIETRALDEVEARAEAQAIAAQMIAAKTSEAVENVSNVDCQSRGVERQRDRRGLFGRPIRPSRLAGDG
jgi:uncharacterized coiled-coil protein SlyX